MPMSPTQLRAHFRAAIADALRFAQLGNSCLSDRRMSDAYWLASKLTGVRS